MTKSQKNIFEIIKNNPQITSTKIAELTKMPIKTVANNLIIMNAENIINREMIEKRLCYTVKEVKSEETLPIEKETPSHTLEKKQPKAVKTVLKGEKKKVTPKVVKKEKDVVIKVKYEKQKGVSKIVMAEIAKGKTTLESLNKILLKTFPERPEKNNKTYFANFLKGKRPLLIERRQKVELIIEMENDVAYYSLKK